MAFRVGSTEAEVIKAYRRHYNKEDSTAGSLVVAGPIYGGVTFEITKGKVSQIFIGASAEQGLPTDVAGRERGQA